MIFPLFMRLISGELSLDFFFQLALLKLTNKLMLNFDIASPSFLGAAAVVGFVGKSVMTGAAAAITATDFDDITHFLFSVNQILFLTHF